MSKENINLPKTAFSMKANLPSKEPGFVQFWDKIDLYGKLRAITKDKEKFIAHNFEGKYLDCGTMSGYINSSKEIGKI